MVFILPVIIGYYLFPSDEKIELKKEAIGNDVHFYVPDVEPSPQETIREVFNAPFNLKWYDVFFNYTSSNLSMPTFFDVSLSNGKNLLLYRNGLNKTVVNLEKGFSGVAAAAFILYPNSTSRSEHYTNTIYSIGPIYFPPDSYPFYADFISVYVKPETNSLLAKKILFFIAWISISASIMQAMQFIQALNPASKKKNKKKKV